MKSRIICIFYIINWLLETFLYINDENVQLCAGILNFCCVNYRQKVQFITNSPWYKDTQINITTDCNFKNEPMNHWLLHELANTNVSPLDKQWRETLYQGFFTYLLKKVKSQVKVSKIKMYGFSLCLKCLCLAWNKICVVVFLMTLSQLPSQRVFTVTSILKWFNLAPDKYDNELKPKTNRKNH